MFMLTVPAWPVYRFERGAVARVGVQDQRLAVVAVVVSTVAGPDSPFECYAHRLLRRPLAVLGSGVVNQPFDMG
jgi:hypothetical protein